MDHSYSKDKIICALKIALKKFLSCDSYLLENNLSEWSITHKIGCYLQEIFPEYDVDCEYNKKTDLKKRIQTELGVKGFRPDIIVHKRGNMENNLLVIQAKKNWKFSYNEEKEHLEKLTKRNREFRYDYGIYIHIPKGKNRIKEIECKLFENGEEVNRFNTCASI